MTTDQQPCRPNEDRDGATRGLVFHNSCNGLHCDMYRHAGDSHAYSHGDLQDRDCSGLALAVVAITTGGSRTGQTTNQNAQ